MGQLDDLSPGLRGEVAPLFERWEAFSAKLGARVDEAIAEADQGLDAIIEQHATDAGPMGAAMAALKSRFHGLARKLDEAREKVDEGLWSILFRDGVSERDNDVVGAIRDRFLAESSRLMDDLEARVEKLETQKNAAWARKLHAIASHELQQGVPCSNCGAPFQVKVYWRASNETCPYCEAMNTISPGAAASLLYQGNGVHALAHEAAFEAWQAQERARAWLENRRHPTEADRQAYLDAMRTYWTQYYQTVAQVDPGFDGDVEAAVAGRLRNATYWDSGADQQARGYLDRVVEAAKRRDEAALRRLMSGERPTGVWGLDDVCEALAERGDLAATKMALAIRHELEGESEPRDAWVRKQLADMLEK